MKKVEGREIQKTKSIVTNKNSRKKSKILQWLG